jgi:anti-sigma factor RsiW
MEHINFNNYESAFLAYHEGTLSPDEIREVMQFLEIHPELKEELDSYENIILPEETKPAHFKFKESLKKALITEENYETFFIASIEGILTAAETNALNHFLLTHPELAADYALFQQTRLVPDPGIVFKDKAGLKRETNVGLNISEELMVEALEGMLDKGRKMAFDQALNADAALAKEYGYFQRTILMPDTAIVYPYKEKLKRSKNRIIWLPAYTYMAVAASLAVLFMIWFFNQHSANDKTVPGLALHIPPSQNEKENHNKEHDMVKKLDANNTLASLKNGIAGKPNASGRKKTKQNEYAPETNQPHEQTAMNMIVFSSRPAYLRPESAEVQFLEMHTEFTNPIPPVKNTTRSRQDEFMTIRQFAASKLQEQVTDAFIGKEGKRHIGWGLAKAAVRTFNRVSGRKIRINENYDDHGELVSIALNGGGYEYARDFKK